MTWFKHGIYKGSAPDWGGGGVGVTLGSMDIDLL